MHFDDTSVLLGFPRAPRKISKIRVETLLDKVTNTERHQKLTLKMMKTMIIGQNVSRHMLYRIIYTLYKLFVIIMNKRE